MKKTILLSCVVLLLLVGCTPAAQEQGGGGTVLFTDSLGREVAVPTHITRVAPSGKVATMIMATVAPEYMVCMSEKPDAVSGKYLSENLCSLPATGQLYGGKSTLDPEQILACAPELIIDLGEAKSGMAEELDALQETLGIPVVFIAAGVSEMEQMYRTLGALLEGKAERGEELAALAAETVFFAETLREKVGDERVRVMFTTGADGLGTNAKGSSQAQVIELVGAENAVVVEDVVSKGGGNVINLEQLYLFDPDVILFSPESYCALAPDDPAWQPLTAVKRGALYEIPAEPYNWMANPPSVNMLPGVWWLGELLYPQYCDFDMTEKTQEIFKTLWNYELGDTEAAALLRQ